MSQVSIGTNGFVSPCAFYVTVTGSIGTQRIMAHVTAIAYGTEFPELPVQTPIDGFYRAAIEAVYWDAEKTG